MSAASLPAVIFSAFVVSFVTVVVPSPITIAASRYAVARGTRAAAIFLTAVTILDVAVFSALAFGLQPLLLRIGGTRYLMPVAGFLLVIVGLGMLVLAPRDANRLVSERGKRRAEREEHLHGPFLAGLLVAAANPGYWIWWTTAGTAFIHAARHWGRLGLTLLLLAFIGGVVLWYSAFLWALHRGRTVVSPRLQKWLLVILGVALVGFGVYILFRTFFDPSLPL